MTARSQLLEAPRCLMVRAPFEWKRSQSRPHDRHSVLEHPAVAPPRTSIRCSRNLRPFCRLRRDVLRRTLAVSAIRVFALALRFFVAIYLVIWMAGWLSVIAFWVAPLHSSAITTGLICAAILVFVFLTPHGSLKFSLKLNIAVILAAAIRVRSSWGSAPAAMILPAVPADITELSLRIAPLALIAAWMIPAPERPSAKTALLTFTLALAGSLAAIAALDRAIYDSRFYAPSLPPNIAMALIWGGSRQGENTIALVLAVSMLGIARFGMSALKRGSGDHWILFAGLVSATVCGLPRIRIAWTSRPRCYDPRRRSPRVRPSSPSTLSCAPATPKTPGHVCSVSGPPSQL